MYFCLYAVFSRMGHERLCFKPYSREQIIKIVENRLDGMPLVFEELAVKMAAAKVCHELQPAILATKKLFGQLMQIVNVHKLVADVHNTVIECSW